MEVILHAEGDKYKKIKEKLLADEIVNRASIVFKEATQFGSKPGYLCIVQGDEERCKRALKLAKGEKEGPLATKISGKEKVEILKKIKEEENKAIEGFGGIFG